MMLYPEKASASRGQYYYDLDTGFYYGSDGTHYFITGYSKNSENIIIPEMINGNEISGVDSLTYHPIDEIYTFIAEGGGSYTTDLNRINKDYIKYFQLVDDLQSTFDELKTKNIKTIVIQNNWELDNPVIVNDNISSKVSTVELFDDCIIYENAFENCKYLKKIKLPNRSEKISKGAFNNCTSLESITIPASVKVIQENAFSGCTSLKNINFSEGLTRIEDNAFKDCTSLEKIHIPDSIAELSPSAFEKSVIEKSTERENGINYLGNIAFSCDSIPDDGKVVIRQGTTVLGKELFKNNEKIISVELPDSLTDIGDSAFEGCTNLKKINIPTSVSYIPSTVFTWCNTNEMVMITEKDSAAYKLAQIYHIPTELTEYVSEISVESNNEESMTIESEATENSANNNTETVSNSKETPYQSTIPIVPICIGIVIMVALISSIVVFKKKNNKQ